MRAAIAFASVLVALVLTPAVASAKLHKVYVKSVALSQTTAAPGTPIQVNYVVGNRGVRKSGRRTVRFYLTLSASSGFKGSYLGAARVPAGIEGKSTRSAKKRITIPPNTSAGAYLVMACISGKCKATTVRVVVVVAPVSTGVAQLAISPTTHDYGIVVFPGSEGQLFTVTNVGSAPSGPITISIDDAFEGGNSSAFSISPNGCAGLSLPAGQSCALTVTLTSVFGESSHDGLVNVLASPGAAPGTVFATVQGGSTAP